ncbi:MAG: OmpH family outer membrane protein [Pseudomonadota bacterium]
MPRAARLALALVMMGLVWNTPPLGAQDDPAPNSAVLVLDQERFFAMSLYGQRVQEEIEAASLALGAENRAIEADLIDEELRLTDMRQTLPRDEFLVLAEEFDLRVEAIRDAQDAKARALSRAVDLARQQFFDLAIPILLELVRERGGAALLDRRTVLLVSESVDITDAAVARVDAAIGRGPDTPLIDLDTPLPEDTEPATDD